MKLPELKIAVQREFEKLARITSFTPSRSELWMSGVCNVENHEHAHYTLWLQHRGGKVSILITISYGDGKTYAVAVAHERPYEDALWEIRHQLADHHTARKFWG